jgi:hypothetical protein
MLGFAFVTAAGQPPAPQTVKGTKFEILLPALLPLVGPGAITPMEKVPGLVRNEPGMLACISVALTKFETKFTLELPEEFHVTFEFATNPEPLTVRRMSGWFGAAPVPLGLIEVIEELMVGEAPR